MYDSIHDNINGVDLSTIEADTYHPINIPDWGRTQAYIQRANKAEDTFHVRLGTAYETVETTVSGDAFVQRITVVDNSITDDEFNELQEGDAIVIYAKGPETKTQVFVEEVNYENNEVLVTGETHCQTLNRWVSQSLIFSPNN